MGLLSKSNSGPTVGIDIGSSLIKVVEARPGKDGIQITALGVAPTPPDTIENENIIDPQTLGQAIRDLLDESGITCKRSVSSVSGQSSVIVRIIEVPKMTKQELAEAMKWEIERHVPFAANEVVMDFQPIERPTAAPDDQNMEVLLAVAQKDIVNSHVETLFAAGLEPVAIDVEPLAACRSLIDISINDIRQQVIAIVNIGSAATELGVYQNGLLAFPRTLPIAGDAITRALSEGLGIPMQEAERFKREKAVVLLDRAAQFSPSVNMPDIQSVDNLGESDETADAVSQDIDGINNPDLDFIPGLGYDLGQDISQAADKTDDGGLDFDIDIGKTPEPSAPIVDFDLSTEEEEPQAPKAPLDLSEPIDSVTESDDLPAPVVYDLSSAADSSIDTSNFSQEMVFDAMAPVLNDLIAEIRRSLEYYASRFQSQPDRILLCGGTAKLKDLDELLQNELGIPVVLANPMENLTVFSRTLMQDYIEEVATIFPVSAGLAIRDMIGD